MKKTSIVIAATMASSFLMVFSPAYCDEPNECESVVSGYRSCLRSTTGGSIDWTEGVIIAEGRGYAEGTSDQQRLMARRAAKLDAAANALAISLGINVDANGRASGIRNGQRILKGYIKGFTISEESWNPDSTPPEYRMALQVPFWGVKGISKVFIERQRKLTRRQNTRRVQLVRDSVDVSDAVLIIDARGTDLQPCLFPEIITDKGAVLYDINTVTGSQVGAKPLVHYVERELRSNNKQTGINVNKQQSWPGSPQIILASYEQDKPKPESTAEPAGSPEPDKKKKSKRKRRRVSVKAKKAEGELKGKIVLTQEDADKLSKSEVGSSLLRESQVVIVVDSAAAGVQGMRDKPSDPPIILAQNQ